MSDQDTDSDVNGLPKVEIGWIIEGDLAEEPGRAARAAADDLQSLLSTLMPKFAWVFETVERPLETGDGSVEPVRLLDTAEIDRDAHGWDFAFVVTGRELRGRDQAHVLGMTSGIFSTVLLSTAFLIGRDTQQTDRATLRLRALSMHLFGRVNGLAPDQSDSFMRTIEAPQDLDHMDGFSSHAIGELTARMHDVADLRVEELQEPAHGKLHFYARSLWLNRSVLPSAILRMRPWIFPLRLPRLTTAAGSALAVLVMTAESWEVAANLGPVSIIVLSLLALGVTSAYLLKIQRLLAPRQGPLREQRAVSNVGTVVAVAFGMGVTYLAVFAVAYLLAVGLFGDALLESWVGEPQGALSSVRLRLSGLAASLSVIIGALGASFEPYGYFRHVTQIDKEI